MILYFISCFENINSGAGGHYYSLLQMHKAIEAESKIVVFGDFFPPMYEAEEILFIKTSKRDVLRADICSLKSLNDVKIVHVYDVDVGVIGSKVAAFFRVPLVYTKPGGPPAKFWSMSFQNQVVFHPFDYRFFTERKILSPKNIALIPNRVSLPSERTNNRLSPFALFDAGALKIIRIARIGHVYQSSILQAIHLADKINAEFGPAVLAVVGTIVDKEAYYNILKYIENRPYVKLYVDRDYTINAAELIPFADVGVGTGRGLIEGLSYGKPMFFPVANEYLPCFVDELTYNEAFYHNFSQRVPRSEVVDPEPRFDDFIQILKNGNLDQIRAFSKALFARDHLVNVGAEMLLNYYRQLNECERLRNFYFKRFHSQAIQVMKALLK